MTKGQMSESFLTMIFLSMSGGLMDAYSYSARGGVFANAQTGNVVLLSVNTFAGEWSQALHYLVPILAFAAGVLIVDSVRNHFNHLQRVHWRQLVLVAEIFLSVLVGFLPNRLDMLANVIVSLSCAMQVQAFRKVDGYTVASTMCTGNLRSGIESLNAWRRTGNKKTLTKAGDYFGVILLFGVGAGAGSLLVKVMGIRTIWCSAALLLVGFLLMFIKEDIEENPELQKELQEIREELHEEMKR